MKSSLLVLVLIFLQSCSWFESDYDKLMNPIKKIKLAEKKAGKPNPVFDGVVEPNFPDDKENSKTLEGVDSNHDGVRDDIEIWINRTAEDQYVRLSLKHLYIKYFAVHKSVWIDEPVEIQSKKSFESTAALSCLTTVLWPYDQFYLKRKIERSRLYFSHMHTLVFNNLSREKMSSKIDSFEGQEEGQLAGDFSHCNPLIDPNYFKLLQSKFTRDWSH